MVEENSVCFICDKALRVDKSHFCSACQRHSHAKCNDMSLKVTLNAWLCKMCNNEALPFGDTSDVKHGNDLSYLKSYFKHLNSISGTFSNFDFDNDDNDYVDNFSHIDCKYYSPEDFISIPSKSKSLSFFHLNIASLEKHFYELTSLFSRLNHKFDVIGISETRIQSSSSFNSSLEGYKFLSTPAFSSVGGTAIYISKFFDSKPREDLSKLVSSSDGHLESVFAEIVFKNRKNLVVGCIYKHPHMEVDLFNNNYLSPLLKTVDNEGKSITLLGDFNIDLLTCESSISHSNFLDILGASQILPSITLPTRITSTSSTLIDNIFIPPSDSDIISGNLTVAISDHLPQFLLFDNKPQIKSKTSLGYRRDWSKFNREQFKNQFENLNWDEILNIEEGDVNSSLNSFLGHTTSLFEEHVPLVKITRREFNLFHKPWISSGLLTSMRVRDSLFREYLSASSPDIKSFLRSSYTFYRNRIVSLLRLSKKLHYSRYFQSNSGNLRKLWVGVREVISSNSSKSDTVISLKLNNSITSEPSIVCDAFNDFYSTIAEKVRSKIPFTRHHFSKWLLNRNPNSFFTSPTSPAEVSEVLRSLNSHKASGPNSLSPQVISIVLDKISHILSDIINLSFSSGIFPTKLKEANVIPVFKNKGSPLEVENYRPISLLSNVDKVFQKLMHKRLIKFLESSKILEPFQFGFRSKHSTELALSHCVEKISKAIDSGKYGCAIFIDLQKAFDTVDHKILLSKLDFYGVRGISLDWFHSFLSNRIQSVSIAGSRSNLRRIPHGVPQGSVLGPLLFLLYINDISNAIPYAELNLFADDTLLFDNDFSLKSLSKRANIDLKLLTHWLNANKISLNRSKTELMIFKPKRKAINFDIKIKINGHKLIPSKVVKYLGVFIDDELNWKHHINFVCSKLKRANGALSKLRHFSSEKTLLSLYMSLFHSHLSYGARIWGQRETSHSRRILTLQKQSLRIISFSDFQAPSAPLFLHFKILSFFDFVKFLNIIFFYKLLNNQLPTILNTSFELKRINQHNRGHLSRTKPGLLKLPKVSTVSFGNNSICYQSILSWNSIQNYFPTDDISSLALGRIIYLVKFYYLSSYALDV